MSDAKKSGPCAKCGKKCTDAEFCFGCKKFVCEKCDINPMMGSHKVEEHFELGGDR